MSRRGPTLRAILRINGQLLASALLSLLALWLWSNTSVLWWGLGLLAVFCAFGAISALITALGLIRRTIMRDREIAAYERKGGAPQSDRLVSSEALRKKGLIR
ncbi:hypothetical protein B7H23_03355 [Notoacmeibacter marinus]|uniref:Uncharacterized protein n=1 Tax=Notoacmeibacter marinus TaxID=1876515 RepID=A0A231V1J3_9HYPH|nr:hypothetical protein [Notoacmeibacter marinus]OXT01987.1 hypothetical protein B7H23_03355 [Notoacmeibacter marinus]